MRILILLGHLWLLGWALVTGPQAHAQVPNWQLPSVSAPDTLAGNYVSNYYVTTAMTTDSSGNMYQAGFFAGRVRFGTTQLVSQGRYNAFVACWNPTTAQYIWAASATGPGSVGIGGIAVNSRGVFITGSFNSGNTPGITASVTFGATTLTTASYWDLFVAKLSLNGTFLWAKQGLSSGVGADGNSIAVVGANVYVAGSFTAPSVTLGSTTLMQTGAVHSSSDSFVAKLIDNGPTAAFSWVVPVTGTQYETLGRLVAVGNSIYVAGAYNSLATTIGPYVLTSPTVNYNGRNLMIAKLTDQGATAQVAWAWHGSGTNDRLELAATGTSLYLTSRFGAAGVPVTFGGVTLVPTSATQPLVLRLDDRGTQAAVAWATLLGGSTSTQMAGLVARGGTLYIAGTFSSPQQLGSTVLAATPDPGATYVSNDVYLAKLTDTGSSLAVEWAISGGGIRDDYAYSLVLVGDSVYMSGRADLPSAYGTHVLATNSTSPLIPSVTYLATAKAGTELPPVLTGFSPSAGPVGTMVTLSGQNLTQAVGVSFNGVAAPGFTVNSTGTSLTVQVPTGASSGVLRVSTRGGTARSAGSFLVQGVLSASSMQVSHSIALVPNPARESVQLQLPAAGVARPVQVLDALGREVYHSTLAAQATALLLPTGTLAPGCYTVRCLDAIGRLVLE